MTYIISRNKHHRKGQTFQPNFLTLILCLQLTVLFTAASYGQHINHELSLAPSQGSLSISNQSLITTVTDLMGSIPDPVEVTIVSGPTYGSLSSGTGAFTYTPSGEFWTLGVDSFTYRVASDRGESSTGLIARALIRAALHGSAHIAESFEDTNEQNWQIALDPSVDYRQTPNEAVLGQYGLEINVSPNATGPETLARHTPSNGGGSPTNGGDCLILLPPPPPPPPNGGLVEPQPIRLFMVGDETNPAFEVFLHQFHPLELSIQAGVHSLPNPGSPTSQHTTVNTDADAFLIHLDWWKSEDVGSYTGGMNLLVNGTLVASLEGLDNANFNVHGTWVMRVPMDSSWNGMGVDMLDVRYGQADGNSSPELLPASAFHLLEPILSDAFQDDLSQWTNGTVSGMGTVNDNATPFNKRLAYDLTLRNFTALRDKSLQNETSYTTRFHLDLSELTMGDLEQMVWLRAHSDDNETDDEIRMHLRRNGANFQVALTIASPSHPSNPWVYSPWVDLPSDQTTLTLEWKAATHAARKNGMTRLWADNGTLIELTGIQNHGSSLEALKLGTAWGQTGTSGMIYVDDFESWRAAPMN